MIKCEFAINEDGKSLLCSKKKTNKRCGYQRWCPTESVWENTWAIHDCSIRNEALKEMDNKQEKLATQNLDKPTKQVEKKIVEQVPVEKDTEIKGHKDKVEEIKKEERQLKPRVLKCRKTVVRKDKLYFLFNGHALSVENVNFNPNVKLVEVTFEGALGKPNFKIISVKDAG